MALQLPEAAADHCRQGPEALALSAVRVVSLVTVGLVTQASVALLGKAGPQQQVVKPVMVGREA